MLRHTMRAGRIVVGLLLVLCGVAMLVLPGPGILVLGAGLALLSADFVWARRAVDGMRQLVERAMGRRHGR